MVHGGISQELPLLEASAISWYHFLIASGYVPKLLPVSSLIYTVHILASGMFQGDISTFHSEKMFSMYVIFKTPAFYLMAVI